MAFTMRVPLDTTLQTTLEMACLALATFLVLNIAAGLARILRGPTAAISSATRVV